VTAARLSPDRLQQAKQAVLAELYPQGDGPRHFRNVLQLIVGRAHRGA
jgi:hypothetical protein